MNLVELKTRMSKKDIPNFLIFTGPELGVLNTYIGKIGSIINTAIKRRETVSSALELCRSKSIFNKINFVVVTDDNDFLKNETAWDKVIMQLGDNILLLHYHTYDKRLKFWNKFVDQTVVFDYLKPNVIAKHLCKDYGLSESFGELIAEGCGCDYTRCLLEVDKIKNLSDATHQSIDEVCSSNLKTGIICFDKDVNINPFVEAFLRRDLSLAYSLYEELLLQGEPVLRMLSFLYNAFKNVLIVQTATSTYKLRETTGITYYGEIEGNKFKGNYSDVELENILYILMWLEQGIKSGTIQPEFVVDFLLVNL